VRVARRNHFKLFALHVEKLKKPHWFKQFSFGRTNNHRIRIRTHKCIGCNMFHMRRIISIVRLRSSLNAKICTTASCHKSSVLVSQKKNKGFFSWRSAVCSSSLLYRYKCSHLGCFPSMILFESMEQIVRSAKNMSSILLDYIRQSIFDDF
jgi:hypothetical protein